MSDLAFQNLLRNINCKTVVFFEDDFAFEKTKEIIVFNYLCNLTEIDKNMLLEFLSENKQESVVLSLKKIESDISFEFHDYFEFTKEVAKNSLVNSQICQLPLSKVAEEVFFVFGLLIPVNLTGDYGIIFDAIKSVENTSIRLFKTYNEFEKYEQLIKRTIKDTSSEYALFVIDHHLTNSTHEGQEIERILADIFGVQQLSFIFSSRLQPDEDTGVAEKASFNLDKLYNLTVNSFYKSVFIRLKYINNECTESAYEIASKNYRNIKYIVKMAHEEGVHSFEAMNNWFEYARNYFFLQNCAESKMNRLAGLIDEHQLTLMPLIEPEDIAIIEKISSHEVFDYSINSRYEPPSLGDIYFLEREKNILCS